jgi:hypothetical protein
LSDCCDQQAIFTKDVAKSKTTIVAQRMTSEIVQMPAITLNRPMKPDRVVKTGTLKVAMIFWSQ